MNRDAVKIILIPTPSQLATCLWASLLIFAVAYREAILGIILQSQFLAGLPFGDVIRTKLAELNQFAVIRTLVIALFWGTVGLISYLIYLTASNAMTETHNEVVIGTQYVNKGALEDRVKPPLVQFGLGLVMVLLLVLTGFVTLPIWQSLFESFLFASLSLVTGVYLLAALAGMTANLYIIWSLAQLIFLVD